MESLFSQRPFRKRRLFISAVAAILLEGSLVGLSAIWPAPKSWPIPETITDLDTGPVLGETVQELIAPKEEPVPTPDSAPTPPPEDTPPPDDTPPPTDDPDMAPPPPPKKEEAKPRAVKAVPPGAKRGEHPQEGVVGGVPHAEKTTGTPGAAKLGPVRVHLSNPPYPYQARAAHITGSGHARATFDSSGHCTSVVITESAGSAILDSNTVSYGKANWVGPAGQTVDVPITYRIGG